MRRHPENPGDLIQLELPRLQKLRLLRRDRDGRVLHPFLQHRHLVGVPASSEGPLPAFPHPTGILDRPRMLQHPGRRRAVGEKLRPVFLAGHGHADGILRHSDRRIAHQPVKSQTWDMQHFIRGQPDNGSLHGRRVIGIQGVLVVQLPLVIPIHIHPVRHQGI